jgi:processive 1,2-diacylglycerol beta-glucosyltransferase
LYSKAYVDMASNAPDIFGWLYNQVNPIPGQEERNSDDLLEEGAAIRCNSLLTLPYKVSRLLDDSSHLARMQAAAQRLSRPRDAYDIVEKLLPAAKD